MQDVFVQIECGVTCYGTPSPELCDPTKITKPMQGHFGEKDDHAGFADPEVWNVAINTNKFDKLLFCF